MNKEEMQAVLAKKQDYEKRLAENKAARDAELKEYYRDFKASKVKVARDIRNAIGSTKINYDLKIDGLVDKNYNPTRSFEFTISDEGNQDEGYNKARALKWHIKITPEEGNSIKIDSGSWSGIEVSSRANVGYMRSLVELLEKIHTIDWYKLLVNKGPDMNNYFKTKALPKEDYSKEMKEIDSLQWQERCLKKLGELTRKGCICVDKRENYSYIIGGLTKSGKGVKFKKVSGLVGDVGRFSSVAWESLPVGDFVVRMFGRGGNEVSFFSGGQLGSVSL